MTFGKAVILRSYLGQKSPKHRFTKPCYDGTSLPTCNWIMFAAFQSVFGQLMTVLWHTALVACLSTNIRLLPLQSGKLNHQSINQALQAILSLFYTGEKSDYTCVWFLLWQMTAKMCLETVQEWVSTEDYVKSSIQRLIINSAEVTPNPEFYYPSHSEQHMIWGLLTHDIVNCC